MTTYGQLLSLLEKANLSPEAAAPRLGVSNMTLRRWRSKSKAERIPELYRRAFAPELQKMTAQALGFDRVFTRSRKARHEDNLLRGIQEIGSVDSHRAQVDGKLKKIASFMRLGGEWKPRVKRLLSIVRSERLPLKDKLIAYGALFYLLTPLDFIPDSIPVVGLLDDFAILGIAIAFYLRFLSKTPGAHVARLTR